VSGLVSHDLCPATEMEASFDLEFLGGEAKLQLVTSREAWREQEGATDPVLRARLLAVRDRFVVVGVDHVVLGFHGQADQHGGYIASPLVNDIVDMPLHDAIVRAGGFNLRKRNQTRDMRHLMYALHNGCHWFVTTDDHFVIPREALEAVCRGLRIVRPSELMKTLFFYGIVGA